MYTSWIQGLNLWQSRFPFLVYLALQRSPSDPFPHYHWHTNPNRLLLWQAYVTSLIAPNTDYSGYKYWGNPTKNAYTYRPNVLKDPIPPPEPFPLLWKEIDQNIFGYLTSLFPLPRFLLHHTNLFHPETEMDYVQIKSGICPR